MNGDCRPTVASWRAWWDKLAGEPEAVDVQTIIMKSACSNLARANPPRRIKSAGIAMQQQRRHQPRIERRRPHTTPVAPHDRRQIEALPHQRYDQPRKVLLRHMILHARRQQLQIVDLPGAKFLAQVSQGIESRLPCRAKAQCSDRLLVVRADGSGREADVAHASSRLHQRSTPSYSSYPRTSAVNLARPGRPCREEWRECFASNASLSHLSEHHQLRRGHRCHT